MVSNMQMSKICYDTSSLCSLSCHFVECNKCYTKVQDHFVCLYIYLLAKKLNYVDFCF